MKSDETLFTEDSACSDNARMPADIVDVLAAIEPSDPAFAGAARREIRILQEEAGGWVTEAEASDPEEPSGELELSPEESRWYRNGDTRVLCDEARQVLIDGIHGILLIRYGQREQYLRSVEKLDHRAAVHTEWMVTTYREMLLAFGRRQFAQIRTDIENDHRWHTGFQDAGRQIGRAAVEVARQVTRKAGYPEVIPDQMAGLPSFIEATVEKHLSGAALKSFCETTDAELHRALKDRWASDCVHVNEQVRQSIRTFEIRPEYRNELARPDGPDPGSTLAAAGLISAATASVVLAAGWHTLSWAMTGLFLPMMPVVLVASLGVALLTRDARCRKLLDAVDRQQEQFESTVTQILEHRSRTGFRSVNEGTAHAIRQQVFDRLVGHFDPRLLDQYIRALEDWLDQIIVGLPDRNDSRSGDRGWMGRAEQAMRNKDPLAAAMYGTLVFEQLLLDLNRRHRLQFNFRVPHHNRAFIDRLSREPSISATVVSALRSLKGRRDMFAHRMHQVAFMGDGRRQRMIRRFLDDLRAMMETAGNSGS